MQRCQGRCILPCLFPNHHELLPGAYTDKELANDDLNKGQGSSQHGYLN